MCELMGLCFARPVCADFSIREFALRGEENADGWGLGWYPDRSLALVKEPVRWGRRRAGFHGTYRALRSAIYVAHVRHRTVGGEPTHADTHPFRRELRHLHGMPGSELADRVEYPSHFHRRARRRVAHGVEDGTELLLLPDHHARG